MQNHWPIILVEGVIVFGGALAFGWWQLRSIRMDREKAALLKAEELAKGSAETADTSAEGPQGGSPPPLTARSADPVNGKPHPPPR